jgi:Spy/CpxP family protein refolding chaperone
MRRQTLGALAILLSLAMTGGVRAQSEQQQQPPPRQATPEKGQTGSPRWMWWKDEKFRAEVGFSLAQGHQIDKIVMPTLEQMWPLRREVDQLDKEIEKMIVDSTDLMVFKQQVEKVEARRAELNKMRTVMLYRIRRVLTPEQNVKFRAAYDRREAERKKQDGDRRK